MTRGRSRSSRTSSRSSGASAPGSNPTTASGPNPGPLEDARYAGVGVLHVEDGVLVGLADGEVQVEVHLGLVRGAHVEVARHVLPDLVEKLVQGDDVTGALAELHLLALAHELDQAHDLDVQELPRQPERHQTPP